jgi:hypothetical protein
MLADTPISRRADLASRRLAARRNEVIDEILVGGKDVFIASQIVFVNCVFGDDQQRQQPSTRQNRSSIQEPQVGYRSDSKARPRREHIPRYGRRRNDNGTEQQSGHRQSRGYE